MELSNIEKYREDKCTPLTSMAKTECITGIKQTTYWIKHNPKEVLEALDREVENDRHPAQEAYALLLGSHARLENYKEEIERAQKVLAEAVPIIMAQVEKELNHLEQYAKGLK